MADLPRYPDTGDDTSVSPDRGSTTGTPRWVRVFGIIAVVVIVLLVFALLGGGGGHGPGRHTPSGDAGGDTQASSVTEAGGVGGNTPLEGGRG